MTELTYEQESALLDYLSRTGLTLDELAEGISAKRNKLKKEKEYRDSMPEKCFKEKIGGKTFYHKVLKVKSSTVITCLSFCDDVSVSYLDDKEINIRLEKRPNIEDIFFAYFGRMTEISFEEFTAALHRWADEFANFNI